MFQTTNQICFLGDSDPKDYTKKSLQVGVEKITKMRIYTLNMSILGYHRTLAYI